MQQKSVERNLAMGTWMSFVLGLVALLYQIWRDQQPPKK